MLALRSAGLDWWSTEKKRLRFTQSHISGRAVLAAKLPVQRKKSRRLPCGWWQPTKASLSFGSKQEIHRFSPIGYLKCQDPPPIHKATLTFAIHFNNANFVTFWRKKQQNSRQLNKSQAKTSFPACSFWGLEDLLTKKPALAAWAEWCNNFWFISEAYMPTIGPVFDWSFYFSYLPPRKIGLALQIPFRAIYGKSRSSTLNTSITLPKAPCSDLESLTFRSFFSYRSWWRVITSGNFSRYIAWLVSPSFSNTKKKSLTPPLLPSYWIRLIVYNSQR